jgi:hypothetical protein
MKTPTPEQLEARKTGHVFTGRTGSACKECGLKLADSDVLHSEEVRGRTAPDLPSPSTPEYAKGDATAEQTATGVASAIETAVAKEVGLMKSELQKVIETVTPKTKLIFSAMRNVMRDVVPIAKLHEHEEDKFFFRQIDEVCAQLQPLLVTHGIIAIPEVLEHWREERPVVTDQGGSWVNLFTIVRTRWHLYCAIDGSEFPNPCVTMGEGVSEAQHSTASAQTMAFKQMLWEVFVIPVYGVKDPEATVTEKSAPQYVAPAATTEAKGGTAAPSLFDNIDPPAATTDEPKKKRKRGEQEPQTSVAGALDEQPAVKEEPISPGFVRIAESAMNAKGVTKEDVFKKFGVEGWSGIKTSQMDGVMGFINTPKE